MLFDRFNGKCQFRIGKGSIMFCESFNGKCRLKRLLLPIGFVICFLLMSGCQCYSGIHSQKISIPMSEGMNFSLISDQSITIVGVEGYETCDVRAFLWVSAPTLAEACTLAKEQLQLELVQDGENYSVEVSRPDDWDNKKHQLSIRYAVMLPSSANINIVSTHGDIEIINMTGHFIAKAPKGECFCMGCGSGIMQDKTGSFAGG